MTTNDLLDAIGMVDDSLLAGKALSRVSRRVIALIAAVLVLVMCMGSAMALSTQFRQLIFSIFQIQTPEQPPAGSADPPPSGSDLQELNVVDFDGVVNVHYFTSDGLVLTCDGGFYTCSQSEGVPEDPAFWELGPDGLVRRDDSRVDLSLVYGEKTFRILFDHAILNGNLCIKPWPQGLEEDPVGSGWNITPLEGCLDRVLLTLPVLDGDFYTHDFLLLDLNTLETRDLLDSIPLEDVAADACQLTSDLHYGILSGIHRESGEYGFWLLDLAENTLTALNGEHPYFLDHETMVLQQSTANDRLNVLRWHLPTDTQTVVIPDIAHRTGTGSGYRGIQYTGGFGSHALVYLEEGSVDLVDLRTGDTLAMSGLDTEHLVTSEGPGGARIMLAVQDSGFSSLGLLDPETGVMEVLTRETQGVSETFWGWLDSTTPVLTARDSNDGYYIYVYQFHTE